MKKLSSVYFWLIMAFFYVPIFVLMAFSFNESKSRSNWTGFTFDWYVRLFQNETIITAFLNTLLIAFLAAVISTIVGTMAAVGINNLGKITKGLVINITYMPIVNPEIVTGVSLSLLFVFVRQLLVSIDDNIKFEFGFLTLLLAHISFCIPYVIMNVLPKLRQMDKNLYEAALDLGCSPVSAFFKVVIHEIIPGVVSGFLMAFTFSLDDFVISFFVSGPQFQTLPLEIYSMVKKKVSPEINALSTLLFLVVMGALIVSNYLQIKKEKQKVVI